MMTFDLPAEPRIDRDESHETAAYEAIRDNVDRVIFDTSDKGSERQQDLADELADMDDSLDVFRELIALYVRCTGQRMPKEQREAAMYEGATKLIEARLDAYIESQTEIARFDFTRDEIPYFDNRLIRALSL